MNSRIIYKLPFVIYSQNLYSLLIVKSKMSRRGSSQNKQVQRIDRMDPFSGMNQMMRGFGGFANDPFFGAMMGFGGDPF